MPSRAATELVEQNRPNGSPDLEFEDAGHTIVLVEGQQCIDETGREDAVVDGQIYRDSPAPSTTSLRNARTALKGQK